MLGYESIMICGRAPDGLPRVLSLDNDGHIPGIGTHRYYTKVLSYGPIAYWPLWDAVLPTAEELVNSPAQDGTHVNVTLGQPGIGDGQTSCLYDGATSYTDVYSVPFRNAFNGSEGTVLTWGRVANAGVWIDGVAREIDYLFVDANNFVIMRRPGPNNVLDAYYMAGGVLRLHGIPTVTTSWFSIGLTWSRSTGPTGETRAFLNGAQIGAPQANLGNWAGVLQPNLTSIGGRPVPSTVWDGYVAHAAVFDRALSPAAILDLSIV